MDEACTSIRASYLPTRVLNNHSVSLECNCCICRGGTVMKNNMDSPLSQAVKKSNGETETRCVLTNTKNIGTQTEPIQPRAIEKNQ